MIHLRKTEAAFGSEASWEVVEATIESNHLIYAREHNNERIYFVVNPSKEPISVSISVKADAKQVKDIWNEQKIAVIDGNVKMDIPAVGFGVVKVD